MDEPVGVPMTPAFEGRGTASSVQTSAHRELDTKCMGLSMSVNDGRPASPITEQENEYKPAYQLPESLSTVEVMYAVSAQLDKDLKALFQQYE